MGANDSIKETLRYNETGGFIEAAQASTWIPAAGVSTLVTNIHATFGPVLLYTVPSTGLYNISYYIVNTTSGGGSDAVGQLVFNYTDPSGGNALYASMPSGTNATLLGNGSAPVLLVAGSTVTYTLGSAVFSTSLKMEIATSITHL